jgi:hypothetical protein
MELPTVSKFLCSSHLNGPTAEALHIRQFPTKSPGFMIAPEIYSINGNNIDGKLLHLAHIRRHHTCEIYSLCRYI